MTMDHTLAHTLIHTPPAFLKAAQNHPQIPNIGRMLVETAYYIYAMCGAPEDFCVRQVNTVTIEFGKENRVIWNAAHGNFQIKHDVTPQFRREWYRHSHNGGNTW